MIVPVAILPVLFLCACGGSFRKDSLGERTVMSIDVEVHGDIERAIRSFRKKVQIDGVLREYRQRQFYLKPSVKKKHKRLLAERRRHSAKRRNLYRGQ